MSSEEEERDVLAGLRLDDSNVAAPRARLLGRTLFGHGRLGERGFVPASSHDLALSDDDDPQYEEDISMLHGKRSRGAIAYYLTSCGVHLTLSNRLIFLTI